MKPFVFISYCSKNEEQVAQIEKLFATNHIQYWICTKNISRGLTYFGEITRGIEESDIFLFVYSNFSNTSDDQIKEMGLAKEAKKLIIPFMLDNSEWNADYRYIASANQGIKAWEMGMEKAMAMLLNDLRNYEKEGASHSDAPIMRGGTIEKQVNTVDYDTDDEIDLDYEDAIDLMHDHEQQDALRSLQASFNKGNRKSIELINKILFLNFGIQDWDTDLWEFFQEQAEAGHSFAHLAFFYQLQSSKDSYEEAAKHLRQALKDTNNGYAFLCEGISKERGIGTRVNLRSAMKRYEHAYKMGIIEACSYMGKMYLTGNQGVEIDKSKALNLLTKGAEQGDARSYYILGTLYADSHFDGYNKDAAIEYFKKAIELQLYEAWISLGKLYQDRFAGKRNDDARHCYVEALKYGIKDAHAYLARLYWKEDKQEDAVIEAQKGARANNVKSLSLLGEFYETGLQDEQMWIKMPKPDYEKAWKYYQQAFQIGGRIEDAISMARLYVNDELRPADITWEVIEGYLEQGAQVPIIEAIELMIKALTDNGRAEDAVRYLKIGAESGSLTMKHEYGLRVQSSDEGEALRHIQEAGEKRYQPSVEWLIGYYKARRDLLQDCGKWMTIAIDMGIEIPHEDYVPYLFKYQTEHLWTYLYEAYEKGDVKALFWMAKYQKDLSLPIEKVNWLIDQMKERYKTVVTYDTKTYELYADLLIQYEREELYDQLIAEASRIDPIRGEYFQIYKKVKKLPVDKSVCSDSNQEKIKTTVRQIKEISSDKTIPYEWKERFNGLITYIVLSCNVANHWDLSNNEVLLVDDVPLNLLYIKRVLYKYNFQIRTANGGQAALDAISVHKPDIILLDLMMPNIDGFELIKRLRMDNDTRDISIILVTALNSEQDISRAFKLGANDFINKPIVIEKLIASLNTQVALLRAKKQLLGNDKEE